jgi:hypothetical protein
VSILAVVRSSTAKKAENPGANFPRRSPTNTYLRPSNDEEAADKKPTYSREAQLPCERLYTC